MSILWICIAINWDYKFNKKDVAHFNVAWPVKNRFERIQQSRVQNITAMIL